MTVLFGICFILKTTVSVNNRYSKTDDFFKVIISGSFCDMREDEENLRLDFPLADSLGCFQIKFSTEPWVVVNT